MVKPIHFKTVVKEWLDIREAGKVYPNIMIYNSHGFRIIIDNNVNLVVLRNNGEILSESEFNEENYIEACRLIKKLFMEEE